MTIKERIPKSEIHFYIQKVTSRGFKKIKDQHMPYFYLVTFERRKGSRTELLTMKYTNNGWLSIY